MKKCASIIILYFMSVACSAQERKNDIDSLKYYQQQLAKIRKTYYDSLYKNGEQRALLQNIFRLRNKSDHYGAFMPFIAFSSADFQKFNTDNSRSGFSSVNDPVMTPGLGFSSKRNNLVFELGIGIGLNKKTKKNGESIKTSFSLIQLLWGYDFIKSRAVNIYPYAGLVLRSSTIEYIANKQINPAFTNISNIVQNNPSIWDGNTKFGYHAGVGFEFVLTKLSRPGGTIVFVKAGTSGPFGKDKFTIEGLSYNPKFKFGEWIVTAGFKFFGK